MPKIYPVIMCGGAGTRLWPLSVKDKPKQFHSLVTNKSMLQETILRSEHGGALDIAEPSFVCALSHESLIRAQCEELSVKPLTIILEPCARNTAPVAAAIAAEMAAIDPEGLILLLPADHHIEDPEAFWTAVGKGMASAKSGYLTTFGIEPTRAETGYGYIKAGKNIGDQCVEVSAFVEKPNKATAEKYVAAKNYFWNGGIFLFSSAVMLEAFKDHAPDILQDVKLSLVQSKRASGSVYLDPMSFSKCRSESIDYAIMENAERVAMVCPVNIGWTDIGSWEALRDYIQTSMPDALVSGNATSLNCTNSLIRSDGPYVAAIGLDDIIVVASNNSVLIVKDDSTQDVKSIVQKLKENKRTDLL